MSGEKDQISGRVKQAAGDLTDDDDLKQEGEVDEAAGDVKGKVAEIADKVKDGIDDAKDELRG